MDDTFRSGSNVLACHLKVPPPSERDPTQPGMILCHGFPIGPIDARRSAGTYPQLIDRIALELGFPAMTFTFRGCGDSTGDFSLQGWIDDLRSAIDHLCKEAELDRVVVVGTNTEQRRTAVIGDPDDGLASRHPLLLTQREKH